MSRRRKRLNQEWVRSTDPAPRPEAGLLADGPRLLAAGADVRREAKLGHGGAHFLVVVALVQAEVLGLFRGGHRPLPGPALQRGSHQLHVVAVGPGDGQAHRDARRLGQQAALGALFAAVGGVGAGFFSPPRRPAAPWSSLHPWPATPSPGRATRRSQEPRLPEALKDPGLPPLLEAVVRGGAGAKPRGRERVPLAAGAQHKEDRLRTLPIRRARPAAPEAMGVFRRGQKRRQLLPERVD